MGLPDDTGSVGDSADLTIEVPHKGLEVTLNNDLGAENEGPCSWGPFAPRFCQVFLSPKVFLVCICWAGAIQVKRKKKLPSVIYSMKCVSPTFNTIVLLALSIRNWIANIYIYMRKHRHSNCNRSVPSSRKDLLTFS